MRSYDGRVDVRYLQAFLSVVDHGSIAEAGRRLDLAPTTVAQQLRTLEAELGTPLLARTGRTLRLTLAGERVLETARGVVGAAQELRSLASSGALPAGPLRLGSTPTGLMGLMPPVLARWNARYPSIGIFIEPGTSATLIHKVESGLLDAAIVVHPTHELIKSFAWQAIREEALILLTRDDVDARDPLAVVARAPYIRYDRGVRAGKLADEYLRSHGIRPKVQFELDGIEQIATFVEEGLGVSIVPDWPASGPARARLRRWALPEPCPRRTVGLIAARASTRYPLVKSFAELLPGP